MPCSHPRVWDHISWWHQESLMRRKKLWTEKGCSWRMDMLICGMFSEQGVKTQGARWLFQKYISIVSDMTEVLKRATLAPWNSIRTDDALPRLGWLWPGEWGHLGFRAPTVPGFGTTAPMAAESLAKSRMQRLCPDGVLKMNRNGNSSFCHTAKSYFLPGRTVFWPALRDEKTLSSWGLQAAEIWAICPSSVGPPDFSHSYSSFTCFLAISTRPTFQYIAVVGSRSSCSTFSFITSCYQNCWHTYLYPQCLDSSNAEHKKI